MARSTLSALVQDTRFEVVRELGRTEDAAVWLVWDHVDEGFRAIKILSEAYRGRTTVLRAFVREARELSRLDHPGVARVYRTGLIDGRPYVVTEYADGGSAQAWVERHGPVPAAIAAEIVADAADAVQAAHRKGVVHRDLKPSNLMLSRRGTLVTDFGVARSLGAARIGLEDDGYAAPEQRLDDGTVGARADVYALGATLYYLVTGKEPGDLAGIRPGHPLLAPVPAALRPIVIRACDRLPERRYASAQELADALRAVVRDLAAPRSNRPDDEDTFAGAAMAANPGANVPGLDTLRRLWEAWVG